MLRIAVTGANGRMGRQLIQKIIKSTKVMLGAALVRPNSELYGLDVGELFYSKNLGVKFNDNLSKMQNNFDVLIDFTKSESTLENLNICCRYNKNITIGTTGFSKDQKKFIEVSSKTIGIVYSENFSIGINIMLKLVEKTAYIIGNSSDIEIIEMHHKKKKDFPSGTALAISKSISEAIDQSSSLFVKNNKIDFVDNNVNKNINCSVIRAGDIIGEHTVMFINNGERLEITHKASNREIFANGAIHAAIWISEKNQGLFNMNDVLELK